jgi:uncharacterized delta-60 repeat protein
MKTSICCLPCLLSLLGLSLVAAPGELDSSFDIGTGFNGTVNAIAGPAGGPLIVVGSFTDVNGEARTNVVRLAASGQIDAAFQPARINNTIEAVVVQADGKVIIGGAFTEVNGVGRNRIARLNGDGTLDVGFDPGTGFNSTVQALALQENGRIVVGGSFTQYQSAGRPYLVRLLTDGSVDASYGIGSGPNNSVQALVLQPDGKALIGGAFTEVNGVGRNRIARLNANGALDPGFDPGAGFNSTVETLAVEGDGRIVVGGSFTLFNGTGQNRLVRLTPEGLLDASLSIGAGFNSTVETVVVQGDGKVLVGGRFTQYAGATRNRLVRLLPEGAVDPVFNVGSGANNTVHALWVQSEEHVLVGGEFTQINEINWARLARLQTATSAPGGALEFALGRFEVVEGEGSATIEVVRIGPDDQAVQVDYATANGTAGIADYEPASGTLSFAAGQSSASFTVTILEDDLAENDETVLLSLSNPSGGAELGSRRESVLVIVNDDFPTGQGMTDWNYASLGLNGSVLGIAPALEGRLMVVGDFTVLAGVSRNRIARLNEDGTVDGGFNPAAYANNTIEAVVVQADGKAIIGGAFTEVNGVGRNRIARLNGDGTLDVGFDPGTGFNSTVQALALQENGRIVVGGSFTQYQSAGRPYLVRLLTDGSVDASYGIGSGPNNSVQALVLQPDGKALIGGAFTEVNGVGRNRIARLNANGALDPGFDPGAGFNSTVETLAVEGDGRIVVGGSFTLFNGTGQNRLVRLTPEGLLDASLSIGAGFNSTVETVVVQGDGKVLVGGRFTQYAGATRNRLVRLLPEGAVDPVFNVGSGANNTVHALWVQSEEHVLVGGEFTQINEINWARLARLLIFTAAPPLPIEFLSIWTDGIEIELELQGTVGQTFDIEAGVDLVNWEVVASGIISSSPFTVVIPSTGEAVEFYRAFSAP